MLYRKIFLPFLICLFTFDVLAQAPKTIDAAALQQKLEKLNTLGSVLYIAAHPDDENTELIAYFAKGKDLRTGYMSLTRGDGGQNLIGTEQGPLLGIIRTNELLAARRIDAGEQFFSRAVDFGYSKTADETLQKWNEEQVLEDMVWVIRKFSPDVIVTRFPPAHYNYRTHGHHEASAALAEKAFDMAADKTKYPDQLKYVDVWQPKRLYWNTSTWFYSRSGIPFDPTDKIAVDVGAYDPLFGESYAVIAAESRSQHKSQGFGAGKYRGTDMEYLEFVKGDKAKNDILEGVNTNWSRIKGGEKVGKLIQQAVDNYNFKNPSAIVPTLVEAYKELDKLNGYWVNIKKGELKDVIKAASGIFLDATADSYSATPGGDFTLKTTALNRSNLNVELVNIKYPFETPALKIDSVLSDNLPKRYTTNIKVPQKTPYSQPYWLADEQKEQGMFVVLNPQLLGNPETGAAAKVEFTLKVNGVPMTFTEPVVYKFTDRVEGEVYRPFNITPPVTANLAENVYLFPDTNSKIVTVTIRSWKDNSKGLIELKVPQGWDVMPKVRDFNIAEKGTETKMVFSVSPQKNAKSGELEALLTVDGEKINRSAVVIDYKHIPIQTYFPPSKAKLTRLDIKKDAQYIGYIMGAGDDIPTNLRQVGYNVTLFNNDNLTDAKLDYFDAIILGIRALNTEEWLRNHKKKLLEYVENGGTLIVQYNTVDLKIPDFWPYPMKIGRDRVTVEEAPVKFINPEHPILNYPNKLSQKDFENWIQERGLYFASEWDQKYTPILAMNDPGEEPAEGALLVAEYGRGAFIYTGISFFRELPAGVPGAYRLMANLIAYKKNNGRSK